MEKVNLESLLDLSEIGKTKQLMPGQFFIIQYEMAKKLDNKTDVMIPVNKIATNHEELTSLFNEARTLSKNICLYKIECYAERFEL